MRSTGLDEATSLDVIWENMDDPLTRGKNALQNVGRGTQVVQK